MLLLLLLDLAVPVLPASVVDEALVSGDAAARVLISNTAPRTTVDGEILPAHDGGVYHYGAGAEAGWYFYGMSYGLCKEDPEGGCADHSANACGFRDDHNVSIYRSPDLGVPALLDARWQRPTRRASQGHLLPSEGPLQRPHQAVCAVGQLARVPAVLPVLPDRY